MPNLDETLASLDQLKGSIEQDSCISKEPFIKLQDNSEIESIPELKYNIPQATCYPVSAGVNLDVAEDQFKASELEAPVDNYFDVIVTKEPIAIRADLDKNVRMLSLQDTLQDAKFVQMDRAVVADEFPLREEAVEIEGTVKSANLVERHDTVEIEGVKAPFVNGVDQAGGKVSFLKDEPAKAYASVRMSQGYYLEPFERFSGVRDFHYREKPVAPKPQITMILHYKMCSFSGDYGAGQTIKTFSLLPGEKTEISIRHFQRREDISKKAQHILDSFSTSSADELQKTVDAENTRTFGANVTSANSRTKTRSGGFNAGLNLGGVFSIGGNYQGGSQTTNASTMTSAIDNQMRTLNKSVNTHVSKADALRQIDINTESTSTNLSESEETINRSLENYNKSRVLNFVFRQLLQEYISITSLVDVTFDYTNGYPENDRSCTIDDLEGMLTDILKDATAVQTVADEIYTYLCNIKTVFPDPDDPNNPDEFPRESLIKLYEKTLENCINPGAGQVSERYVGVRNISQIYDERFPVKGIITDVTTRITRTGSLVCDALLGQGEALDCYNQKLQDAASVNANLDNLELVQKIASIENITDPAQRAEAYKQIFGECCATPQTQVIS